jgi:hypothetical protein
MRVENSFNFDPKYSEITSIEAMFERFRANLNEPLTAS